MDELEYFAKCLDMIYKAVEPKVKEEEKSDDRRN